MSIGLVPLRNYGAIDAGKEIYRSAQPMYNYEFKWMRDVLGIEYIINLRAESNHSYLGRKYGINVINIRVKDHHPPTLKQAQRFISLIRSLNKPILIHCEHGHGRTSTFSVLAKIGLGMPLDRALMDEKKRFHYKFNHHSQVEFLKKHFNNL